MTLLGKEFGQRGAPRARADHGRMTHRPRTFRPREGPVNLRDEVGSAAAMRLTSEFWPPCCFACAFGASGCPSQETLGASALTILGAGVVNNPSNKSLRFDVLKFGLERFCFEMLRRGAPLKLSDDQPVVGRFFAESCQSQVIDDESRKSFVVQFMGKGYAWIAALGMGGRVGFTSTGLIEYAPDFQLHDGRDVHLLPPAADRRHFVPNGDDRFRVLVARRAHVQR